MKVILDTHIWIRWVSADQPLDSRLVELIEKAQYLAVSAVSCWEVAYLAKRGRITLPLSVAEWLHEALKKSDVEAIPISSKIGLVAAELPDIHRDPADRFIIATALTYDYSIISFDRHFPEYEALKGKLIT